jgi:hypothetical protein
MAAEGSAFPACAGITNDICCPEARGSSRSWDAHGPSLFEYCERLPRTTCAATEYFVQYVTHDSAFSRPGGHVTRRCGAAPRAVKIPA